jgi:hypothetical protein
MKKNTTDSNSFPKPNKHELLGALRTFDLLIQEIESGYKFDDPLANKILEQARSAKLTIEKYFRQSGIIG